VWLCWHLSAGNVKHQSLADFIHNYDADKNELISILLTKGPAGLLDLPAAKGFRPKDSYINSCELCQDVLAYLEK